MKKNVPTILWIAALHCMAAYMVVWIGRTSFWNHNTLSNSANHSQHQAESGPLSIDLNTASAEDLLLLPGMDRTLANKIIQYREEYGDYVLIRELKDIDGMTEQIYNQIKDYLIIAP